MGGKKKKKTIGGGKKKKNRSPVSTHVCVSTRAVVFLGAPRSEVRDVLLERFVKLKEYIVALFITVTRYKFRHDVLFGCRCDQRGSKSKCLKMWFGFVTSFCRAFSKRKARLRVRL